MGKPAAKTLWITTRGVVNMRTRGVASTSVVNLEPVVSLVPVHNKAIIVATFRINFYLSSKGSYPQAKCKNRWPPGLLL